MREGECQIQSLQEDQSRIMVRLHILMIRFATAVELKHHTSSARTISCTDHRIQTTFEQCFFLVVRFERWSNTTIHQFRLIEQKIDRNCSHNCSNTLFELNSSHEHRKRKTCIWSPRKVLPISRFFCLKCAQILSWKQNT